MNSRAELSVNVAGKPGAGSQRALRVLLIAPSLEILGGQAVQATRLLASLRREPSVEIEFQPINPKMAERFRWLQRVKFVRTAAMEAIYSWQLVRRVSHFDVIHAFSAGNSSYMLWTIPALIISRLFGKALIVNYRDGQAEEHLTAWRTAATTLRMADRVISPSDTSSGCSLATGSPPVAFSTSSIPHRSSCVGAGNCDRSFSPAGFSSPYTTSNACCTPSRSSRSVTPRPA